MLSLKVHPGSAQEQHGCRRQCHKRSGAQHDLRPMGNSRAAHPTLTPASMIRASASPATTSAARTSRVASSRAPRARMASAAAASTRLSRTARSKSAAIRRWRPLVRACCCAFATRPMGSALLCLPNSDPSPSVSTSSGPSWTPHTTYAATGHTTIADSRTSQPTSPRPTPTGSFVPTTKDFYTPHASRHSLKSLARNKRVVVCA